MSKNFEPNPPSRKEEDFPKTNTMPSGWVLDDLTAAYNPPCRENSEETPPSRRDCPNANNATPPEDLFTRRLDMTSAPGEGHGMWL